MQYSKKLINVTAHSAGIVVQCNLEYFGFYKISMYVPHWFLPQYFSL